MAYDDDEDLYGEEFDFVDEDDDSNVADEDADAKPKKRPAAKDAAKDKEKPPARAPKRAKAAPPAAKREPRREPEEAPPAADAPTPEYLAGDDPPLDDDPIDEPVAQPGGPPADHVVHIYEHGKFKRTIVRKFTDEEAVTFAEEYTRTGKAYGRYAIATPDDEEPAPTFAGAAKG